MSLALAYIALGSNLGDRLERMRTALDFLEADGAVRVRRLSSVYQNRAIGMGDAADFYNAVAQVETDLDAEALLDLCLAVETRLGRERRTSGWAPRSIDLDLLLFADEVLDSDRLTLPHPRIAERDFVAVPLSEVGPEVTVAGVSIQKVVDSLERVELTQIKETLR